MSSSPKKQELDLSKRKNLHLFFEGPTLAHIVDSLPLHKRRKTSADLLSSEDEEDKKLKEEKAQAPPTLKLYKHNPHLKELNVDYLYHLGLHTGMDLPGMFGDVKYVLMGGSAKRMSHVIQRASRELPVGERIPVGCTLRTIGKDERFSLFKIGCVLAVNHGMGQPSLLILLHEITKLLAYAQCKDVKLIRIGTSGGLGVPPGTVVVSDSALGPDLTAMHTQYVLGKAHKHPALFDTDLTKRIIQANDDNTEEYKVTHGKTMSTNDFYEEQARTDGFFSDHTPADRMTFLKKCSELGVVNIEMESTAFGAFTHRAGISAAVVCTTLVDRLQNDQVSSTPEQLAQYAENVITAVFNFIRKDLACNGKWE